MWTRQNDGFYFNKGLKGPNFVYFSSNFDAASFFELIVLRDSCSSCFSSISYGFRDKPKESNKSWIPKFELSYFSSNFNAVFYASMTKGGGGAY